MSPDPGTTGDSGVIASALDRVDEIVARAKGRGIAVFLDYDGTLTPIVDRPELAVLDERVRDVLHGLAQACPVAIVSGRDLADVRKRVGIDGIFYAGSHGFDIAGPGDMQHAYPKAFDALPALAEAERELARETGGIEGALIERKRFGVAIHYRLVKDSEVSAIERAVEQVVGAQPTLRRTTGKKVFELRPDVDWDKGRAVLWLDDLLGSKSLAIYVGDDDTDEDAFRALERQGVGIAVLDTPRATAAQYRLRDPDEVCRFLEALAAAIRRVDGPGASREPGEGGQ